MNFWRPLWNRSPREWDNEQENQYQSHYHNTLKIVFLCDSYKLHTERLKGYKKYVMQRFFGEVGLLFPQNLYEKQLCLTGKGWSAMASLHDSRVFQF